MPANCSKLNDGRQITYELFKQLLGEEASIVKSKPGSTYDAALFTRAANLLGVNLNTWCAWETGRQKCGMVVAVLRLLAAIDALGL